MHERVAGYADAVLEASAGTYVGPVADELQAFVRLSDGSTDLAWAGQPQYAGAGQAGDNPGAAGQEVVGALLDLLSFAVQSGPAANLTPTSPGFAAAAAARTGRHGPADEGPLGRIGATQRLEGYATAVLLGARRAAPGRGRGRAVPFHADRPGQRRADVLPSPPLKLPAHVRARSSSASWPAGHAGVGPPGRLCRRHRAPA